ncbi:MAG: vanadium-dependent haloperoxidase [Saprospiraceae bacterium]|nr:vanadium-dependent haloperoxidase [Saprospiraceae bacterium]
MRRYLNIWNFVIIGILSSFPFLEYFFVNPNDSRTEMLEEWSSLILELERTTGGYRPPVAARMHGYIGLGAYLASIKDEDFEDLNCFMQSMKHHVSLDQIGMDAALSVNSSYARLAELFFITAPPEQFIKIKELESKFRKKLSKSVDLEVKMKSIGHGIKCADLVWKFSVSDKSGHDAFLYNYDETYIPPECSVCWQKTGNRPMPALLPKWKNARTLIVDTNEVKVLAPPESCETDFSKLYQQAYEVMLVKNNLAREDKWIAEFWSDDIPGLTMSPPGRWFSIATQAANKVNLNFQKRLEVNLTLGLAMSDISILVWNGKYTYHLMRPETFIQNNVSRDWFPHIPTPAFPTYPSGHSAFGAVADVVLSSYFGEQFELTDNTHKNRTEFDGTPRTFSSFKEMSIENAWSRVLAGVHFRMDCDAGLDLGYKAGHLFMEKIGRPIKSTSDKLETSAAVKNQNIF